MMMKGAAVYHTKGATVYHTSLMYLSMSCPTYPRAGRRWGFVGDSSPELVLRVETFATRISVLVHTDVISAIISRGFVIWKLSPRVGNLREFVIENLQIFTSG